MKREKQTLRFILFFVTIIYLVNGCVKDKTWDDDKLTFKKLNYTGTQIKLNGYYYQKESNYFCGTLFFYKNGILITWTHCEPNMTYLNNQINDVLISNNWFSQNKGIYGIFNIDSNSIKYEVLEHNGNYFEAHTYSGIIINDTTFKLTKTMRSNGTNIDSINSVYYFQAFNPKPDSTNKFIQ